MRRWVARSHSSDPRRNGHGRRSKRSRHSSTASWSRIDEHRTSSGTPRIASGCGSAKSDQAGSRSRPDLLNLKRQSGSSPVDSQKLPNECATGRIGSETSTWPRRTLPFRYSTSWKSNCGRSACSLADESRALNDFVEERCNHVRKATLPPRVPPALRS